MMFIDFQDFTQNTESVVRQVCSFVGADPVLYHFKPPPAGMKVSHVHWACVCHGVLPLVPSQLYFRLQDGK